MFQNVGISAKKECEESGSHAYSQHTNNRKSESLIRFLQNVTDAEEYEWMLSDVLVAKSVKSESVCHSGA